MSAQPKPPRLVCITPIRDEAWILETFLKCASVWADEIILADQNSVDSSRAIAARFPKVRLVENANARFDEASRQRLLLEAARQSGGSGQVIIALDADEVLAGDVERFRDSVLTAAPGTVLEFEWRNVLPDLKGYWVGISANPLGYVDDGHPHTSQEVIHGKRIPVRAQAPRLRLESVSILHLQYVDWERMRSKQRSYLCQELEFYPWKRPLALNRAYRHMDAVAQESIHPLQPEAISCYVQRGIDPFRFVREKTYRWDVEVAARLASENWRQFRHLDVWEDWNPPEPQRDAIARHSVQRGRLARWLIRYQRRTQRWHRSRPLRALDALIALVVSGTVGKPPKKSTPRDDSPRS